ncbi:hypothetical protein CAPTEDRAFT_203856 [Capitella teleta]|uniref:Uncharacterized protein n=1 Tax=Capitella teleta TaxID=283909 RepID=R7VHY3_CAPTE|nr:hypothetical protein CAPTEDRAFT_203856 [Capitella teleta]|eukprot:ELU18199.1 hypothetical protein CAPTEDRAFT_203856 [Capitella teleta]
MRPVRRYNMEDMLTDLTSLDDADGINPVYQWVWVEPGIDEDFFNGNWAFRKPYRYVGHINGELRELKMWVEDDYGEKHAFAAGGQMCAHLMWSITRKGCEEGSGAVVHANPDPLEGVVMLNLDGDEGIWNMGGIVDWSGWSRVGMRERTSAPASFEVAPLSVCQSFERYPRAAITGIGVGMPDFLADYMGVPNNLHVAPWGETPDGPRRLSEDSLLEAAVPRYKRIAPVPVAHTRVVLSPVPTEPDKFDYENYKTGKAKIVLHVRRIAECIER